MIHNEKTDKLLISHYQQYPKLEIQDIFKFIYQSCFGCEHMIASLESAIDYIQKENSSLSEYSHSQIDDLDGEYSRVHFSYLKYGLSVETFGKLFFLSAKNEPDREAELEKKLDVAKKLILEKKLPFSSDEFNKAKKQWQAQGYMPIHHSEKFKTEYNPAYRVIANIYVPFLRFFATIDTLLKDGPAVIAIEGGSASGKSTLGEILKNIYDCNVLHMDDFFLRPEQRTADRYSEAGGNIDRERFLEEVLIPLKNNETINYRRFDCSSLKILPSIKITPEKLTIIEGAYSMHPEFEKYYDYSVFLDISPEKQKLRIEKRNSPEMAQRFYNEWIPLENEYFSKLKVKERCHMYIPIST